MKLIYTALKYFALGLLLGLLTAPRSGMESRRLLREMGFSAAKNLRPSFGRQQTTQSTSGSAR